MRLIYINVQNTKPSPTKSQSQVHIYTNYFNKAQHTFIPTLIIEIQNFTTKLNPYLDSFIMNILTDRFRHLHCSFTYINTSALIQLNISFSVNLKYPHTLSSTKNLISIIHRAKKTQINNKNITITKIENKNKQI